MKSKIENLKVKLFADGADIKGMIEMASKPIISGLTTNPTLMKKAGVTNYVSFAKEVLREVTSKPISFEVFSDDLDEMRNQAVKISGWGDNVFVKVPITNSRGVSTKEVVKDLSSSGVKVNVTAVMTLDQVRSTLDVLDPSVESNISVFAGRIADTGREPTPIMIESLKLMSVNPNASLIWASPRELLNVIQADEIGCHIITATNDILNKLPLLGYDLEEFSLDTVRMFLKDSMSAGYEI
jgi:transaldolase